MPYTKLIFFEFTDSKKKETEDLWKNFVFQLAVKDIPVKGDVISFENMSFTDKENYDRYKDLLNDFKSLVYKVINRKMEVFNYHEDKDCDVWTVILKPVKLKKDKI